MMAQDSERKVIFENLKNLADAIVQMFGRNMEVAIHDFNDLQHSLKYIAGEVTKRKEGAPITDLVVKAWRREGENVKNLIGYRSTTKEGRILKCATSFIRDGKGKVIGVFCINFDVTELLSSIYDIKTLAETCTIKEVGESETFASTITETIDALIEQSVAEIGKQPPLMTKEEKVKLVGILEGKGAFLIKGGVDNVAARMGLSKYTIYNYLQKFRATQSANVI
jgi:predicted transcriptional regulator YheO